MHIPSHRGKAELFESEDFKQYLKQANEKGKDVQHVVNGAQAQLFESIGIKGEYGIDYLCKVRTLYADDAEMLRTFFE